MLPRASLPTNTAAEGQTARGTLSRQNSCWGPECSAIFPATAAAGVQDAQHSFPPKQLWGPGRLGLPVPPKQQAPVNRVSCATAIYSATATTESLCRCWRKRWWWCSTQAFQVWQPCTMQHVQATRQCDKWPSCLCTTATLSSC